MQFNHFRSWYLAGIFVLVISGCGKQEDLTKVPPGFNMYIGIPARGYAKLLSFTPEQKPLHLGAMTKPSEPITIQLFNQSQYPLEIPNWRSPCPCIELQETPERILPGESAKLVVTVDPESYDGKIVKNIPITCRYNGKEDTVFLPLEFIAGEAGSVEVETANAPDAGLFYHSYEGGSLEDPRYRQAAAWIFSGPDCPECNYVKMQIFPAFFQKDTNIIQVNLEHKDGLNLLLELEKKLKVEKPGDSPVLYYRNQLFYGSSAIKQALNQ